MDAVAEPTKTELRAEILLARRALAPQLHDAEAEALLRTPACVHRRRSNGVRLCARRLRTRLGRTARFAAARAVCGSCCPSPATTRPGSRVPLQWGEYRPGGLVEAPFGLREPAEPWLPADAIGAATVVLVPALAVDRTGVRLGRGAGFYDRSLPLAAPRRGWSPWCATTSSSTGCPPNRTTSG